MNNSKVKVAVRVRPLNPREEGLKSECVVRVSENQITLLPPISCKEKARKEPHIFIYDNCFWTKDKYDTGQEDVFKHLGDGVLQNIWLGFNVCIFAYGQTGSGKTFSMMGTDDQPGIVPRICSALFNKESNDLETIRIEASYFEIYNEEVRDLLRSENNQTKLRVREDRLLGPYVEELSCHAVQSYEEIKLLLDQGNKQRAIAETKMNEQSSRSHAILALTVTQTCHKMSHDHMSGASRELVSKVSLVDLAGSERSYKSGAQGSQLKESCNINKSLLTLGLVINSLAEISENKRKSQYVNYRDSVLTWLLKNNLGGNSKTIMLATVSPAADNYQETLSTLRYADSAKRIVNQAVVNEDVKSKAIEELQEEIKRLREQLTTTEHVKTEVQKLKSQLEEKENLLSDLKTSWEEKLKRTEVATQEWKKNLEHMGVILKKQNVTFSNDCYLMQQSTSLTMHNINDIIKIGSGPSQDIQISGPEAECEHCVIRKTEEGEVFLIAVNNSKTHVNGCLSKIKTQLWHEDKIQIGTNVFELLQPRRPKPEYMRTNVSSEAEVQTYDELNTDNGRSPILSERDGWNSNMIEKSKTKSAFYKANESSAPTIPASDDDLNSSENKQTSDMFTQISNEPNRQPIDMEVNTTKSEYLEIGEGTEDIMVPCSPQYGEASSQTSEMLVNSNGLQSNQDLEDRANLPRILEISREKKELQRTLRRDMCHPSPDNEMEEPDIPLCDTIPNDPVVTSLNDTCEENQNVKTQNVPPQQSNSDTSKASPHENVLHPECNSFSEKSQAEPDLNTSSKTEPLQNDKDLCDNDREVDKEVASGGPPRTHRQDMSPTSPGDDVEESNIPTCDQISVDSGVTSQHNTCEENQNEKSEEVPHQQSNPDTYNTCSHENVLHQECDSSSEESKAKPDLNTSSKIELLQNEKGLCDNDGDGDTNMASGGLQKTRRQDTTQPSPHVEIEKPNISPSDKIPDDSQVTSQHETCEENQHEKTEEVPPQQSNSDTNIASPHENVLHQECEFSSEKPKAEPDLNTSSKIEMQKDKGLCDNDREGDKEVASDELQRTRRQDTSHPHPDDKMEEPHIPLCDKIPDDPVVTSQNDTCEENQNVKTQNVPPQQSNSDTCKGSPHENVLHPECDSFSEKSQAEPDLNTSSKREPLQNDKDLCDNDGEGDKEVASDGLQTTHRQDMSPTSPGDEMEEYNIPTCDQIPDDSGVTSQHNTCEENQNEKSEEVPHQQSNTDNTSSHESVVHQECDSSSEESKAKPDLNTSPKIELLQNDKGLCDNGGDGDTDMASGGLQRTRRQDTSHPHPDDKIEEPHIPLCDKIPDDPVVTSQNDTCEENQNGKTQNVPPQQSNSDTCKGSPHENVLHPECDSFSEKSQAEPDLNTSSKREPLQNDKDLCDNDGGDKEVASDGLQTTHRQDMSPTSPGDEMEEYNIPTCDQIPDDSGVTSQHNTCEENQNEKSEEVPHQQSNPDTYNTSSHENVLHQECDSSSEESKAKPDLNTSSKIELLQNEKGLCDNDGDGDTNMASGGLQKTRRQDTSHPSPHVEIEKPNISPSDKIPDDSQVTLQHETCEESQHEKTEEVPPQQSNSDTNIASPHENVLHQECEFSSEKPKAEPDLNTSSKIEMQNDKGLCDNDREGDKEVASDELQRTRRQDMSHTSLDDKMEESNIPPGDKLPDDTSQHHTCKENQNEKTEEVPHQQSNTDTYNTSPRGSVLHQESDDSSEKPKVEPDLNTSSKKELPQNDKGHCDLDGENDTGMSSDDDFVDCSSEFTPDEEHTSCESTIQLQNAAKDSTDPKEPDIDPNTLSSETSIPSVFSEESRKEIQNEKENMFKELLEKMKIDTKQTSKLTLQKVLEIGPESLMTDDPCDDDNALWYFVRRLMSLNGDARNINKLFMKSEESGGNKDDSFISFDESDSQNFIHPLDVVSAAFHCSDHFLQQEIMSKMSMCQFAVPLLLPDADGPECTFMLWAMRGIVKKWRPQSLADSKGFIEDSLVNVQMPTISFVRLGNCRLSKSKILNQLLGTTQHQHEHFIHRDMEGGNAARKISDGLVEISWYFPGGKGKFPEPVAFTNLRGTMESNMKEFNFLIEISSVIVILTEGISKDQYDLLMKYNGYDTKFLLIISPENTRMKEDTQERLKLLAPVLNLTQDSVSMIPRNTNETTAGSKLYSSLLSLVQNNIKTLSLEEISKQASRHGIRIDEDFGECQEAKLAAKEITEEIEDVEKYKKETMKLQAGPLKEMAKFEKEMCQMKGQGNSNGEKYKSNLRKKCNSIRQNQWECDIPTGISKFVNALTSTNTSEKFYFLQWLKFYLDVEARKCLYPLQAQYKEICNLSGKQKELTELDQKISDSSLGIEHFLREVGQFYEAWHSMGKKEKSTTINFESLPKIAADLLLDGFPLELIDGDASRIPLQWIKDVLTELDKKVKGKSRLRVITVLGVQSTGKSTLLNTMFGLQFPVASGRCTRGAFMTLLRVKEHFQSYFMCQFILVIDTEGLKAPELDSLEGSYEHDNELATLVIGLSDITLINMSMENTTEMKDILQIVIHAFLRMKEIGKKPNCQFVHQNVSDVSAPSMNMRGRKKMMDQLDEMTRTVAVMEKKTQFSCFSDIMEYDLEHNNCYIAGLWHGGPPMASVSSAYSENVNELKQKLLKIMKDRHKTQNIIEFILWVSDIWSAVKHENFIFSFRNSVIAKAYNQLSIKYSEREWKFNKLMHEWFTNSETLIKNQSAETLEAKANKCKKDAECILTREGKEILAWLEEYFSKETDGAQLIKYKTDFVISAQNLIKSLETSSITKLNKTIQTQKDNISVQDVYRQQIKRIEQQVSNFIEECRQRKHEPSNAELEEELEKIWNNAAKNLKVSHRKERNIEGEMLLVLTKDMKERGSGVNENIQKTKHFPKPKKQQKTSFIIQTFTTISYQFKKWKGVFPYEDFFQNVLHKCINYSEKQTQIDADYDDTYCREILNIIDENCKHSNAKNYFSADRELELKLAILGHVLVDFQKMHLTFLEKNDPHAKLNSLKPLYFDTFKNCFQKKNESKSLAERVCKNLFKPSLTDHINRKLGIKVVDDIANSKDSEKYTSRMFFQFTVLESLLEGDNFQNYVNYSSDYKNFVKSWIINYIVEEYTNINTLQERILFDIMGRVRSSLDNPPDLNLQGVSEFLPHLCEKLNSDLVLPQQTMKAIIFENSSTIEDFIDYMKKSLTETEEEIRVELQSLSTEDVLSRLVVKPQDELFKKVFGCGKQCPFCKVPCEAGGTDHEKHVASVHRPEGLGRYRWSTTQVLCHDICTTLVVGNACFKNELTEWKSHPYKDYRDFYPDWKIQPDESIEASDYWKFILKEYNKQFAEEYNAKPANYPQEWDSLTREMAKESLQKTFNM